METRTFKTSINCGGCVNAVTPYLNAIEGIEKWNVDTSDPAKLLTVTGRAVSAKEIMEAIQKAGYEIQEVATQ